VPIPLVAFHIELACSTWCRTGCTSFVSSMTGSTAKRLAFDGSSMALARGSVLDGKPMQRILVVNALDSGDKRATRAACVIRTRLEWKCARR
jgi:hypothetical protein